MVSFIENVKYLILLEIADYLSRKQGTALLLVSPHKRAVFRAQLYVFFICFAQIRYDKIGDLMV